MTEAVESDIGDYEKGGAEFQRGFELIREGLKAVENGRSLLESSFPKVRAGHAALAQMTEGTDSWLLRQDVESLGTTVQYMEGELADAQRFLDLGKTALMDDDFAGSIVDEVKQNVQATKEGMSEIRAFAQEM